MSERRSITVVVPLWRPYVRMTRQGKHADPRARQYHAACETLSQYLALAMAQRFTPKDRLIRSPYRVAVCVYLPGTKASKGGTLTASGHDWDNYVKAAIDTASRHGVTAGDSAAHFRGPLPVPMGIYAIASDATPYGVITFAEVDESEHVATIPTDAVRFVR